MRRSSHRGHLARPVLIATAFSLLSMTAYLVASRMLRWPAHRLDYLALIGSTLLGSTLVLAAGTAPFGTRVLTAVLFAGIAGALLFVFMFAFVGVVFGDYL